MSLIVWAPLFYWSIYAIPFSNGARHATRSPFICQIRTCSTHRVGHRVLVHVQLSPNNRGYDLWPPSLAVLTTTPHLACLCHLFNWRSFVTYNFPFFNVVWISYFSMHIYDILRGISVVPFEIPRKISYTTYWNMHLILNLNNPWATPHIEICILFSIWITLERPHILKYASYSPFE